jgi:hypothetical protein
VQRFSVVSSIEYVTQLPVLGRTEKAYKEFLKSQQDFLMLNGVEVIVEIKWIEMKKQTG